MIQWITTSNPSKECWRRLLEFTNAEYAVQVIESLHGEGDSKSDKSNYNKQAQQIRASILQAKEYFDAAERASVITSPNHLYYGMVSLSSAVMLLRGDGRFSLDRLRQDPSNRNHGLDFTTSATRVTCREGVSLLETSRVRTRNSGHLVNWLRCLPPAHSYVPARVVIHTSSQTASQRIEGFGARLSENVLPDAGALLELMRPLPDLLETLLRFGVDSHASRMSIEVNTSVDRSISRTQVFLHRASSSAALAALLDQFLFCSSMTERVAWEVTESAAVITFDKPSGCVENYKFPDTRLSENGALIAYAYDLKVPEFVDAYRVAYGLSNLARYFPDLWVSSIESHCRASKLVERFVEVYLTKAPKLALEHMIQQAIVFSTSEAPIHRW